MIKNNPICIRGGDELNNNNWYQSFKRNHYYQCKSCTAASQGVRDRTTQSNRKKGHLPMAENVDCASFLGIHVAERVLSIVFKDVQVMSYGNRGYDFICNSGKKIDVKSSCLHTNRGGSLRWTFAIKKNNEADYFLLLAFDDRDNLNPLHIWMIPGHVLNHKTMATISESKIGKWIEYKLDIDKVITCCNILKEN